MKEPRSRRARRVLAACGTLAAVVATAAALVVRAEQPAPPAMQGMVIYRDPVTGKLGTPPPGVVIGVPSGPPGPLPERRGQTHGGGFLVDLRGRGTKTMVATRDADGTLHTDCVDGAEGETE